MIVEARATLRLAIPPPKRLIMPSGREIFEISGGATGTAMTNFLEQKLLEHTLRNVAYTSPTSVFLAAFTAVADGEAGTVTEVSTGGGSLYVRQAITFAAFSGGSVAQTGAVNFPVAGTNWGTITHVGVWDASSAGNLLLYGTMTASKAIDVSDQLVFNSGSVTTTFD